MTDEGRERVRRIYAGESYYDVYGIACTGGGMQAKDELAIIQSSLAEHPADDGELVDEAWLRSVGFTHDLRKIRWHSPSGWCQQDSLALQLPVKGIRMEGAYYGDDDGHWVEVPWPKTRGDLRRLCTALQIKLKEQP